jgi:hypothetical protein
MNLQISLWKEKKGKIQMRLGTGGKRLHVADTTRNKEIMVQASLFL